MTETEMPAEDPSTKPLTTTNGFFDGFVGFFSHAFLFLQRPRPRRILLAVTACAALSVLGLGLSV